MVQLEAVEMVKKCPKELKTLLDHLVSRVKKGVALGGKKGRHPFLPLAPQFLTFSWFYALNVHGLIFF